MHSFLHGYKFVPFNIFQVISGQRLFIAKGLPDTERMLYHEAIALVGASVEGSGPGNVEDALSICIYSTGAGPQNKTIQLCVCISGGLWFETNRKSHCSFP